MYRTSSKVVMFHVLSRGCRGRNRSLAAPVYAFGPEETITFAARSSLSL